MRMGIGTTREISRNRLAIAACSVPSPGTDVQVMVELPATENGFGSGRFVGRGKAVRVDQTHGRTSGFWAEVQFQMVRASGSTPAELPAVAVKTTSASALAGIQRDRLPLDLAITEMQPAFLGLDGANLQVQSPVA